MRCSADLSFSLHYSYSLLFCPAGSFCQRQKLLEQPSEVVIALPWLLFTRHIGFKDAMCPEKTTVDIGYKVKSGIWSILRWSRIPNTKINWIYGQKLSIWSIVLVRFCINIWHSGLKMGFPPWDSFEHRSSVKNSSGMILWGQLPRVHLPT